MTFYHEMRDVAIDVIGEFGQKITISRKVNSTYNPIDGYIQNGEQSQEALGVFSDLKARGQTYSNGSLVEEGDKVVTISAKGLEFEPTTGDVVTNINGETWRVLNVKSTSPAGIAVIHNLAVRR